VLIHRPTFYNHQFIRSSTHNLIKLPPNSLLLGDFNARFSHKIISVDTSYGGLSWNTVGPWSLKNDVTSNENMVSRLRYYCIESFVACIFPFLYAWLNAGLGSIHVTNLVLYWIMCLLRHPICASLVVVSHLADFEFSSDRRPVICELSFRSRTTPPSKKRPSSLKRH